jgi:phage shock protein A
MASLLQKIQTLISANLHAMVDQALESNSIKVFDEYIRQAENNIGELEEAAATVGGSVRTLKRKYDQFSEQAEKLDRDIDMLLTRGKTQLAAAAQADLNSKQQLAQEYYEQWQQQQQEYEALMNSRLKLEAKLTSMRQEREHIVALIELTEAKKTTVKAIKSLDDLVGVGDQDVARIGESIRAELDRADARLEMESGSLEDQIDEAIGSSAIDAQLEERRRRLGLEE